MREELSTEVEVLRLLWFIENFFEYDSLSYHEVALYFLIRFPPDSKRMVQNVFEVSDGPTTLRFRWFPLEGETLANLPLLPSFLALGLANSAALHRLISTLLTDGTAGAIYWTPS